MASQKITIALVTVALFSGVVMANAADFSAGADAFKRGDYTTALRVFRQLADQGDSAAQYILGLMYSKGQGVVQDYAEAARWYHKAADQGKADAQAKLGAMYDNGKGVAQDYGEALRWYRKAADQGNAIAQNSLGSMYEDQGTALAQVNLGLMYHVGKGVPQDYVRAHMWYNLAEARGQKIARENRNRLAKQMTPAQISEAQRLAREWKPKGK